MRCRTSSNISPPTLSKKKSIPSGQAASNVHPLSSYHPCNRQPHQVSNPPKEIYVSRDHP